MSRRCRGAFAYLILFNCVEDGSSVVSYARSIALLLRATGTLPIACSLDLQALVDNNNNLITVLMVTSIKKNGKASLSCCSLGKEEKAPSSVPRLRRAERTSVTSQTTGNACSPTHSCHLLHGS